MNYVIIIPAYNEEEFIGRTLESLCNQVLIPSHLIVVDDGSSDATPEIVMQYTKKYPWIHLVQKEKSERSVGSKVVLAFNAGYESLPSDLDYEFIVKLDADLELPPDYFERVANLFNKYPDCGICGGYCVIPKDGKWIREKTAPMHIRGAFKSIRRKAFEQIGGFQPVMGWDGIDQIKLLFNGWKFGLIDSPVKHFRPTGNASNAKLLYQHMGEASYRRGYDLFLTGLAALKLTIRRKKPFVLIWYIRGFIMAWLKKESRHLNNAEIKFFKKLQYQRIFAQKKVVRKYAYTEK